MPIIARSDGNMPVVSKLLLGFDLAWYDSGPDLGFSRVLYPTGELAELTPLLMTVVFVLSEDSFIDTDSGTIGANATIAICTVIRNPMTNIQILMSSDRKLKSIYTSLSL